MKILIQLIKKIKDILKKLWVRKPKPPPVCLNDRVRLVGKISGYYVTIEKYEGKPVVKNACAVAVIIIGAGLFYILIS